jgi:hypothetical protein
MKKSRKNKIYLAIGILVCAIVLTSVVNWNYIINYNVQSQAYVSSTDSKSPYRIFIYYFPSQEHKAQALTYYLSEQKYFVEMFPAESLKETKLSRNEISHIFYNHDELIQAIGIKKSIESIFNYPINAYKFSVSQSSPSMMIILTDKK